MLPAYVYAHEKACSRIQSEGAWPAASLCVYLAFILEKAFCYHFAKQLGDGRHAGRQLLAEVGYAVSVVLYAQAQDCFFKKGALPFVVQKCFH